MLNLSLRTSLLTLSALLVAALVASSSPARESRVRIAAVTLHGASLDEGTVRSTLGEELDAVSVARSSKRAVLTVSVAKEPRADGGIEYLVSAVASDAHGGKMLGMVEGHALVSGTKSTVAMERSVLKSAVHGAMGQLPSVLR